MRSFDLRVVAVVQETPDASSFSFEAPEGARDLFAYRPGQFLTLAVPTVDGEPVVARCYSLSSSPYDDGPLTVTVKRTAGGYASNWLCDNLRVGSTLRALPPSGLLTPSDLDADLLLLAGGSGITPIISILRSALVRGSGRIALLYANRDAPSTIFARELAALAASHPERLHVVHWLESDRGLPSAQGVRAFAEPFACADAFVCGPEPFMDLAMTVLRELGLPRERRHREKFLSLRGNPFGDAGEQAAAARELEEADEGAGSDDAVEGRPPALTRVEITLEGSTYTFDDWGPTTRLIEHLESKGLAPPFSCREGQCSTCAVRLLEGEVKMLANEVLDDEDLEDGIRLACQSLPVTDLVRAEYE